MGLRLKSDNLLERNTTGIPGLRLRDMYHCAHDIQNQQYVILQSSAYFYQSEGETSVFYPSQAAGTRGQKIKPKVVQINHNPDIIRYCALHTPSDRAELDNAMTLKNKTVNKEQNTRRGRQK